MTPTCELPPIVGPACIGRRFATLLHGLEHEQLWLVTLRSDHSVIAERQIKRSSDRHIRFKPRELLRPAVIDGADVIVFLHNHPSGDASPSDIDKASTDQIRKACAALGIRLLDSIIVANGEWYSFETDQKETT